MSTKKNKTTPFSAWEEEDIDYNIEQGQSAKKNFHGTQTIQKPIASIRRGQPERRNQRVGPERAGYQVLKPDREFRQGLALEKLQHPEDAEEHALEGPQDQPEGRGGADGQVA